MVNLLAGSGSALADPGLAEGTVWLTITDD
jgi:hypothetical protein